MKHLLALLVLAATTLAPDRPNVLLLMSDDLAATLGCYGHETRIKSKKFFISLDLDCDKKCFLNSKEDLRKILNMDYLCDSKLALQVFLVLNCPQKLHFLRVFYFKSALCGFNFKIQIPSGHNFLFPYFGMLSFRVQSHQGL